MEEHASFSLNISEIFHWSVIVLDKWQWCYLYFQGSSLSAEHKFKLVVVGGGAGGCGTANKFVDKFGPGEVCVIGKIYNQKSIL